MSGFLQDVLVDNYLNSKGAITRYQIGDSLYEKWIPLVRELSAWGAIYYDEFIHTKKTQLSDTNNASQKTTDMIWRILRCIIDDMIGEVNGVPLMKKSEFGLIVATYANAKANIPFQVRIENFFARQIIVHRLKSSQILQDEISDQKSIRTMAAKRRKRIKEEKSKNEQHLAENSPPLWKDSDTLYIYKNKTSCHTRQHQMFAATAVLTGRNNSEVELNVEYCSQCKKFLMGYTVYETYRRKYGMLLGRLRMDSASALGVSNIFLSDYSPLKLNGYSVSQQDGYSRQDRQYILSKVIEKGVLQKYEVIQYLEYFINLNGRKSGNEIALRKWEEDLEFVLQYDMTKQPKYAINDIKKY